jgi:murein DD-endopeptidase MepM/ murein hydrolase activator NlpD
MAFVLAVTAVGPIAAHPRGPEQIQQRLEELARLRAELEQREGDVRSEISEADAERDALTIELQELQAVVDEVQSRANAAGSVLARVQARMDAKSAKIRKLKRALEGQLDGLNARAVHVYKRGPASVFDLVLGVAGFEDMLRRFSDLLHITRADNGRITEIDRMKKKLVRERNEISKLRDKAAHAANVVNLERNRAVAVANTVAARRDQASGELATNLAELGDIQRQKEQYERETAQLQSESAAIAAFLRGRGGGKAAVSPRGMAWPASGPLTSGYGWRTHPIFGTRRFHAGIDIGAPSGASIVAAGTGRVIFVGQKSGYGNATIIDHGGGIATLYAHQSAIGVSNGTTVAIGQRIGSVGCTGYCTGPHLHFEVRVNGDPVDPMGWLP